MISLAPPLPPQLLGFDIAAKKKLVREYYGFTVCYDTLVCLVIHKYITLSPSKIRRHIILLGHTNFTQFFKPKSVN
jgi:hypothetical protein